MRYMLNQPLIQDAEESPSGFMHEAMMAQSAELPKSCLLWRTGFLRGRFFGVLSDYLV